MENSKFARKRNSVKKYESSRDGIARDSITQAVNQYLQAGGSITQVESMPDSYESYIAKAGNDTILVDEFLQDFV